VVAAGLVNGLLGKPLPWGYLLVFALLSLVSTIALVAEQATALFPRSGRERKFSF
jgi:hypothetical protein